MQNKKILRCAIYIRVSTEEQHLNGLSLPAQRKALLEYAEKHGYTVVDVYADEGISARKSMKHRKDLLRLLEDVKKNKIDMILVTKLDRWFRNIKDYNITEEILQAHNCYWKTIFENYDSSTANGQMVINIMLSVNQAECDRTSERIKAVFDYKRAQGQVTSGMCAPYGYKVVNGYITKDHSVSHIVEDAFQYYFNCYSKRRVIEYIQEKYGEESPSVYIIDKFFVNEKYAGKNGDNLNYCEPYITLDQYRHIQTITRSKIHSTRSYTYIFSSLLKCPHCGRTMTGRSKKNNWKNGSYSIYRQYRCSGKYDKHPSPCISETVIEEYMLQNVISELSGHYSKFRIQSRGKQNRNPDKKAALSKELERLNMMFQKGRITEEFYDSEYERIQCELDNQDESKTEATLTRYSELIGTFSGNWIDLYNKLDNHHKNAFWKSTIKEIKIDKDTHKLCGVEFLI